MSASGTGELVSEVARLFEGIDSLSYYEFLAIDRLSDYLQVRDAFYARAQRFHPDRFVALETETIKRAVYAVYKRMTEAYAVLSDPDLRRAYDLGLEEGHMRLAAEQRARRLDPEERQVQNPFARVYLRSGRAKLAEGDLDAAWIDVELGLSLEEAPPLRELHAKIVRHLSRPGGGT